MKFAKNDPLLMKAGLITQEESEGVAAPVIPFVELGNGKKYDYAAVADKLIAYIKQENIEAGRSITDIAKQYGIHQGRFHAGLRGIGCEYKQHHCYRREGGTKRTPALCLEAYNVRKNEGISFDRIGERMGISGSTARYWIEEGEALCRKLES